MPGGRCGSAKREAAKNSGAIASNQARHNVGAVSAKQLLFQPFCSGKGFAASASRCVRAILGARQRAGVSTPFNPELEDITTMPIRPDLRPSLFARAQPLWTTVAGPRP